MNLITAQEYKVLSLHNIKFSDGEVPSLKSYLPQINSIDSGTIIMRFRNYKKQGFMPLISFANQQYPSSYLSLYIEHAGKIGLLKHTICSNKMYTQHLNLYKETVIDPNYIQTVAVTSEKNKGYTLYFNGEKICSYDDTNASLFKDIHEIGVLDKGIIGQFYESQKIADKHYAFSGDYDYIEIYNTVIDEDDLLNITNETNHQSYLDNIDEFHRPISLFYPGLSGSSNFRIPTLLKTSNNTLISSIDKREFGHQDHSNKIETIIRRSFDNGKTWDKPITACKLFGNGQTIDSCLLEDKSTGKIFLINNSHPDCLSPFESKAGSSQIVKDNNNYFIIESSNHRYYGHENGSILNESFQVTEYAYDDAYNLYLNEQYVGNLFNSDSPLKIYQTTYSLLTWSNDEGATWRKPIVLGHLKKDYMKSLNVAPGIGIQIDNGLYAGRLCFPFYYYNLNGYASSLLVYSDDHGESWQLGESVNDNRIYKSKQLHGRTIQNDHEMLTECQVVEMPNGYLKMFMRNINGYIAIGTSRDGGSTWDEQVTYDKNLLDSFCQSTVIKFTGKIDDQHAIIFANPSDVSRATGKIKIGLLSYNEIKDDYDIVWKYDQLIKTGSFAYSCLTQIDEYQIGLVYEGTPSTYISFTSININDMKHPYITQQEISYHLSFNENLCLLKFSAPVMFVGNRDLILNNETESINATFLSRNMNTYVYQINESYNNKPFEIQLSKDSYICDILGNPIL